MKLKNLFMSVNEVNVGVPHATTCKSRLSRHHIRVLFIVANNSGRQSVSSNQIDPKQLDLVEVGGIKFFKIVFHWNKNEISFLCNYH